MDPEQNSSMDPLIDEVRERRRLLLEEHGNDLDRLLAAIRKLQEQHPDKVDRPARRPPATPQL